MNAYCSVQSRSQLNLPEAPPWAVPDEVRKKYPDIRWREIAGMRDHLIHGYFSVDYEIVWDVVREEISPLIRDMEDIISKESSDQ